LKAAFKQQENLVATLNFPQSQKNLNLNLNGERTVQVNVIGVQSYFYRASLKRLLI